MRKRQLGILGLVALAIALAVHFELFSLLQFDELQMRAGELRDWRSQHPALAAVTYFLCYVLVAALSIPGAAVLTLAGGALFGFWQALLLVSFASSVGATLAFLVSRVLLRDWVQARFGAQLAAVNAGFARDGSYYLLALRLVPVFPFFLVNLVMGLLPIRTRTYYWVSQLGMLPATALYVNAGTELGRLDAAAGFVSTPLLAALALLALFPLLARRVVAALRRRRALSGYRRPRRFDSNLIVIGAGSAGLVAALVAATVKARVILVERHRMGGDCLNTGCVPSKSLIRSARIAQYLRRAGEFGLRAPPPVVDFAAVMRRVQGVISAIEPHDSVARYTELGVDCRHGDARIVSPWEVVVNGTTLSARNIIIASGARPSVPDIPGLAELDYLTSDTVWDLAEAPRRLLVVGAGPVGCELAQALAALGSEVTVVTRASRLLPRDDAAAGAALAAAFQRDGIAVHTGCRPRAFRRGSDVQYCVCDSASGEREFAFDRVLLAVGRTANIEGLGLEALGIELSPAGTVAVDEYMATRLPTVFACGDVAGPYLFTHAASHQAWHAAVNALFGRLWRFRVDYSVLPWATFTTPEVARVGLTEEEAQARAIPCEVTCYDIADLDRAIADGEAAGFVKVITQPGRDRILGVTIVGHHAAELLGEFVLAMKHGLGLKKILGTIHIYPSWTEANKFAAGAWQRARKPERLLRLVERFHGWQRR